MTADLQGPAESADLLEGYAAQFHELIERVPEEAAVTRGTIGGGEWSVQDLVGHIESWEAAALSILRGEPADDTHESIDAFNAGEVDRKRALSWQEVLSGYKQTHEELVAYIRATSDEKWQQTSTFRGREGALGSHVGVSLGAPGMPFGHVTAHLEDLRVAVEGSQAS